MPDDTPRAASASPTPLVPYWQNGGVRPGFDADQREGTAPIRGPRRWYNRERWEMERMRCHLTGKPQAPWREASEMSSIVQTVSKRFGLAPSIALDYFRDEWTGIVGADVAKHCRPMALEKGTLTLAVAGSVWMFTLRRIAQTTLLNAVKASRLGADVERIALRPEASGSGGRP